MRKNSPGEANLNNKHSGLRFKKEAGQLLSYLRLNEPVKDQPVESCCIR